MRTEDGSIIHECFDGKPEAFGLLVDKYKGGIYAFVYGRLGRFQDAQDVTQEVFIEAYRGLHSLRRWESFVFWLYRIARNLCVDWIKAESRRPDSEFIEDQDPNVLESPSLDSYREGQLGESLREALDALPDTYREVLMLHYFGGMAIKEIARAVGASPAAIGKRLSRARSQLREEMIVMMDTAFKGQRLQASFTFRVVEAVKRIKIQPMPRMAGLPWGLSLATGVVITVLSLNPNLSIHSDMAIPGSSTLPVGPKVLKTGEIPVDILKTDEISVIASKQGDADGIEQLPQNAMLLAPPTQGDTWTGRADMSTARFNLCSAVVDGKIYAIGGGTEQKLPLSIVEEYDPATDTWLSKADMPDARSVCCTGVINGKIYVIGGYLGGQTPTPLVEEYDPATDTWRQRADMPTARGFFATSVVDGKIYAIGGVDTSFGPSLSAVEEYDPDTDTWIKKKNMPNPRQVLSAAAVNGKIYVIGGWLGGQTATTLVEEYDPKTDTWVRKADMPTARAMFSTSVVNGKIYAIGGILNNVPLATAEVYDPVTDTWETKRSMPELRAHHSASAVNGRIYVMGGSTVFAPKAEVVPTFATMLQYNTGPVGVDQKGKIPTKWGEVKSD